MRPCPPSLQTVRSSCHPCTGSAFSARSLRTSQQSLRALAMVICSLLASQIGEAVKQACCTHLASYALHQVRMESLVKLFIGFLSRSIRHATLLARLASEVGLSTPHKLTVIPGLDDQLTDSIWTHRACASRLLRVSTPGQNPGAAV